MKGVKKRKPFFFFATAQAAYRIAVVSHLIRSSFAFQIYTRFKYLTSISSFAADSFTVHFTKEKQLS